MSTRPDVLNKPPQNDIMPAPRESPPPFITVAQDRLLKRLSMLKGCAVMILIDDAGNPYRLVVMPKAEMLG